MASSHKPKPSELRETFLALLGFTLALLLAVACVSAPVMASRLLGPWGGALVSVGSLLAWAWIGPRPMPGLVPGAICIAGYGCISAVGIACMVKGIYSLFVGW
jgi:hypothetical protein